jgi:hypothetical protein
VTVVKYLVNFVSCKRAVPFFLIEINFTVEFLSMKLIQHSQIDINEFDTTSSRQAYNLELWLARIIVNNIW